MRPFCLTCKSKRRVLYKRKLVKGRPYWITFCIVCQTPIEMEPFDEKK